MHDQITSTYHIRIMLLLLLLLLLLFSFTVSSTEGLTTTCAAAFELS